MEKRAINDPAVIEEIINTKGKIAIVGLSPKTHRDSNKVGQYLLDHDYDIIPVRPKLDEVLGQKVYPDLESIPEPVEVVDLFLNPERVGPIVDKAIEIGAKYVWFQLGVINEEAAKKAQEAGLGVVMDKCIKIEHKRLKG
jgi:predicted CoA-binding protein